MEDMAYKAMEDIVCDNWETWKEVIDVTCQTKNRLLSRGGYSPAQRVFGYQQRIAGGLMSDGGLDLAVQSRAAAGDIAIQTAMAIRQAASKAFHEIDCQQAIRAAATHGPRPHYDYQPGQAVYFWRRTIPSRRAANTFLAWACASYSCPQQYGCRTTTTSSKQRQKRFALQLKKSSPHSQDG